MPLIPSPDLAIDAAGLTKRFGGTAALHGLDLRVPAGSVYGLLGPNGAGKTTTVRLLATLLRPDEGHARVLGHDLLREAEAIRRRISLTGQFASVDEDLTGRENLVLLARLLGLSRPLARTRTDELLEAFDLVAAAGRPVRTYSGGMRRRLDIAASLVAMPDLLFLDEPTTGLDPRSREQVWAIVRFLVRQGMTVLLTTQYLEEADQLADRIAVIDRGTVIAQGSSRELKAAVGASVLNVRLADPDQAATARGVLAAQPGLTVRAGGDALSLSAQLDDPDRSLPALAALRAAGVAMERYAMGQPSLDEVFFALTGHAALPEGEAGDAREGRA